MNRKARRSSRTLARGLKHGVLLDFDRMEARTLLTTFPVTNTSSTLVAGSLPYEINQANITPLTVGNPSNTITFDITPGPNPQQINLTAPLTVTQTLDIEGYTQPGATANTNPSTLPDFATVAIVLSGGGSVGSGLIISPAATGSRVVGLDLEGFTTSAIQVDASNTFIGGNFIGVGPDGLVTANTINSGVGIQVLGASGVSIGGTVQGTVDNNRNVITGNTGGGGVVGNPGGGVVVLNNGATLSSNVLIQGNFIGTQANLTVPTLPTLRNINGVAFIQGSGDSIDGNNIGGNLGIGVLLTTTTTPSLTGNTIGGAATGLGNDFVGISLVGTTGAVIGGTGVGDIVAFNGGDGIVIDAASTGGSVIDSTISDNLGIGLVYEAAASGTVTGGALSDDTIQANQGGVLFNTASKVALLSSTILGNTAYGVSVTGSSNVTLGGTATGAGLTVQGNAGPGVAISATSTGVQVLGSSISGNTGVGVSVAGSSNVTLGGTATGAGLTVQGNAGPGVAISATSTGVQVLGSSISGNTGVGVSVAGSSNVTLGGTATGAGLTVQGNAGPGVAISATSTGVQVLGSSISGNTGVGVSVAGSSNVTLGGTATGAGLTVQGNAGPGVAISATSTGIQVLGSSISGNTGVGVSVTGSSGVTIGGTGAGVTITGNAGDGVDLTNNLTGVVLADDTLLSNTGNGVLLTNSPGVTITGSTIGGLVLGLGNGGDGISFSQGSNDGQVLGSMIDGNFLNGIEVNASTGVTIGGAGLLGDTLESNKGNGILFAAASDTGQVLSSMISGNGGVGVEVLDSMNATLTGDAISGNTIGGVVLSDAMGATVNSSATYGLTSVDGNLGVGISVANSPNVTLGGLDTSSGITVANNFGTNISLRGSNNATIGNSDITGALGDGISLVNSTGATIIDDTVNDNSDNGIAVLASSSATITGSTISTNSSSGVVASGSSNVSITGTRITNNLGVGVSITGPTAAPALTSDTIEGNSGGGLLLALSTLGGEIISTNVENNGGFGISITGSTGVMIAETGGNPALVSGNQGPGIVAINSPNLSILDVNVTGNLGVGISVTGTSTVASGLDIQADQILGNQGGIALNGVMGGVIAQTTIGGGSAAGGNALFGLSVVNSPNLLVGSANPLMQVTVEYNGGPGISVNSSSGFKLLGPTLTVAFNAGDGVSLNASTGAQIGGMVSIEDNSGSGLRLANHSDNLGLNQVTITGNDGSGILATDSSSLNLGNGTSIPSLTVTGNQGAGISVANGTGISIIDAVIQSNRGGGILLDGVSGGSEVSFSVVGDASGTNPALGNGLVGISLTNSNQVTLSVVQVVLNAGDGIDVINSAGTLISGSNASFNSGDGVKLSLGSDVSTLSNDLFNDNTGDGVFLSNSSFVAIGGDGANTGVTVLGNHGVGIAADTANTLLIVGATVQGNQGGGISLNHVTGAITITSSAIGGTGTGQGNGLFGITVADSPGLTLDTLTVVGNSGDGIVLTGSVGETITRTFAQNNLGAGIKVVNGSNGALLTTDAVSGNAGPGVYVSGSVLVTIGGAAALGITVIGNQGDGIDLNAATASTVLGTEVASNYGAGINVINSPGAAIGSSTVAAFVHDNKGDGIDLSYLSVNSSVVNTTVLNNLKTGLSITAAGVTVDSSKFDGNGGSGLEVNGVGNSFFAKTGLDASGNKGFGVLILNSANNEILGTPINPIQIDANGSVGLEILGADSTNNLIQYTAIESNGVSGVSIDDGASANFIAYDVIGKNGQAGLQISNGSDNNVVVGDLIGLEFGGGVAGNGGNGVSVIASSGTVIGQSTTVAYSASNGISLVSSKLTSIQPGTVIAHNASNGVSVVDSASNFIGSAAVGPVVTIVLNGQSGVQIVGTDSTSNQVLGSTISGNEVNGVGIANGGGNLIAADIVTNNMVNGVSIANGDQNQISLDSIQANMGNGVSIADGASNFVGAGSMILSNRGSGVQIVGADSAGNAVSGSQIVGNGFDGITIIQATGTTIGKVGQSNVISRNTHDGISITSTNSSTPTIIQSNFIGTDLLGSSAQGNLSEGINVGESSHIQIGSEVANGGNVISANVGGGVEIINSTINTLVNNQIGTDRLGQVLLSNPGALLPNQAFGVFINESANNTIGGTSPTSANVIAGHNDPADFGVQIFGPLSTKNLVAGNLIGITGPVGPTAQPYFALGDHVGVFINSAQNNSVAGNILGGSDFADILVSGIDATDNSIGEINTGGPIVADGNIINGKILPYSPANTSLIDAVAGIEVLSTKQTTVVNNTVVGLTYGIELFGSPSDLPTPTPTSPPQTLSTVQNNTLSLDAIGVDINQSVNNIVSKNNQFIQNSLAGVRIVGGLSTNNTVGGPSKSDANTFADNLYGVYIEDSSSNFVTGNTIANTRPMFNIDSTNTYQAGIYIFSSLAGPNPLTAITLTTRASLNAVTGNTITNVHGYGIIYLDTPQALNLANTSDPNANNVSGSFIVNLRTDAIEVPLLSDFRLPDPAPITVPMVTAQSVGVKVQVSNAFAGHRPISPKVSHHAKTSKTSK